MKRSLVVLLILLVAYFASYARLRSSHIERWDRDGHHYVILPQSTAIYYFYRSLTYLDARFTGMRLHIGPNR
jgi:hypothetical protein